MAKEVLTKQGEYERLLKSVEIAQHRQSVIERRLPELETELEDSIIRNEISGYRTSTIEKLEKEINHLKAELEKLIASISAMQKALPELKRQADIERTATEGVNQYQKAKEEITLVLSESPSLDEFKSLVSDITAYADKLHHAKIMFLVNSKSLFDFMQQNNLKELGSITENQIRQDREAVNFVEVMQRCDDIETVTDLLTDIRFFLYAAANNNPSEFLLPPLIDPDTLEQLSDCGGFKIKKDGNAWQLFHYGCNGWGHQDWYRIYEGIYKPSYPNRKDDNDNWIVEFEK